MRIAAICLTGVLLLPVVAAAGADAPGPAVASIGESPVRQVPDSLELEQRLQALDWASFRSVVEAVPKLKRSVDAYGPFGWEYVRLNYQTYAWRKPIGRLDDAQKIALGELIEQARARQHVPSPSPTRQLRGAPPDSAPPPPT